jgi:D-arginine dehydrogenase
MSEFDVIIVGGGIAGASLGAEIAERRRTLIIEAEDHCGYHSTGRSAAFYLESYGGGGVARLTRASGAFLEFPPADFSERSFLFRRGALHLSEGGWPEIPPGIESRRVDRAQIERLLPGVRDQWARALLEPSCADIDVGALHASYLRRFRKRGGEVLTNARLREAGIAAGKWRLSLENGEELWASIVVNAAGAWADMVARACEVAPLGLAPKRRTMVQLRVAAPQGISVRHLPLIDDALGRFYFKGEGDRSIWLSPHDEIETVPCDAVPDEIDVATAIDRFQSVVDWPVERVERKWAGLRTFAPDRLPVYGFDLAEPRFFWCAGQGGFGIQTSPAAAKLAAALLLGAALDPMLSEVDPANYSPGRFG